MNVPLFNPHLYRAPRDAKIDGQLMPARLGEVLRDRGMLSEKQLTAALRNQHRQAVPLGEIMVGNGMVSRRAINRALSQMHGTAILDLERTPPDPRLLHLLKAEEAIDNKIIPWRRQGAVTIFACAQPHRAAELLRALPREVQPARAALADAQQLQRVIAQRAVAVGTQIPAC